MRHFLTLGRQHERDWWSVRRHGLELGAHETEIPPQPRDARFFIGEAVKEGSGQQVPFHGLHGQRGIARQSDAEERRHVRLGELQDEKAERLEALRADTHSQ